MSGAWPTNVPFDQYQRYRIAAEVASELAASNASRGPLRVLDVGGQFFDLEIGPRRPIAEFLPNCRTVTVDLAESPLRHYVRARGEALPFAQTSFDLVVSVDVLEHVGPALRPALVAELTRVSGRAIVLAAPFRGEYVSQAEDLFARFVERTAGTVQGQLKEHRENGLPDLDATQNLLVDAGWTTYVFPYGNLWRWLLMMIDKHAFPTVGISRAVYREIDERFNRDLFETDREAPCYRHFIVAAKNAGDPVLPFVRARFGGHAEATGPQAAPMLELAALHAANQEICTIRQASDSARYHADLQDQIASRDAYIAKLEGQLRAVERSFSYRIGRIVRRWFPRAAGV